MKISVIIPVKPGGAVAALAALKGLDHDSPDHEIIVAEGKRPSRQRNQAAKEATGEILYFLDDDALIQSDALKRLVANFTDPHVAAIGGPSITPSSDTPFQRAVAWALASSLGGGAIRNRYRSVGVLRDVDDSELILCNLAFRKDVYLSFGGLDERLYPNEENELIDRLLKSGHRLLHDPEMYVQRSQRPTLAAFVRQMKTYGKGRAEQTLISRSLSFKAVIPALFALYLLTLPFMAFYGWYLLPGLAYAALLAASSSQAILKGEAAIALRLPLVYTLLHFCYGAGFISGFFAPRYKGEEVVRAEVQIKCLKEFGSCWSSKSVIS
ncbi:MAG: glycosyltransferase [Geobacteraceae bacterium]|nr:glycosyltransferase [Geobacteraceae bacterium]